MNNVNITGRVAKDPETRGTVTTLIVATDRVKLRDGKTYVDEATGYTAKESEQPCRPEGHLWSQGLHGAVSASPSRRRGAD
jgi:hypothetical protein